MKNVLILHGKDNDSTGNWFPWLEEMLLKKGFPVWTPDLPHPEKPNIQECVEFVTSQWKFNDESIIVGHSSGAVLILALLAQMPKDLTIDKAILVAGFTDSLGDPDLEQLFVNSYNWEYISQRAREIILFHSDNDPYVSVAHGEKLKDALNAELIVLNGQGHFNLEVGSRYRQFPALLKRILQ